MDNFPWSPRTQSRERVPMNLLRISPTRDCLIWLRCRRQIFCACALPVEDEHATVSWVSSFFCRVNTAEFSEAAFAAEFWSWVRCILCLASPNLPICVRSRSSGHTDKHFLISTKLVVFTQMDFPSLPPSLSLSLLFSLSLSLSLCLSLLLSLSLFLTFFFCLSDFSALFLSLSRSSFKHTRSTVILFTRKTFTFFCWFQNFLKGIKETLPFCVAPIFLRTLSTGVLFHCVVCCGVLCIDILKGFFSLGFKMHIKLGLPVFTNRTQGYTSVKGQTC